MSSFYGYRPQARKTVASVDASLPVCGSAVYAPPVGFKSATSLSTASDLTYTAKQVLSGMIIRDLGNAARTDTLPTATLLQTAFKGITSGSSLDFTVRNVDTLDSLLTIAVGSGITAYAGTRLTINRGEGAHFTLMFSIDSSGVCTATLYRTNDQPLAMTISTATQGTSGSTTVVCHGLAGVITCFGQNMLANALITFTLTNTYIRSTSVVLLTPISFNGLLDGTAGYVNAMANTITNGSCSIVLFNPDAAAWGGGVTVKIGFLIIQ